MILIFLSEGMIDEEPELTVLKATGKGSSKYQMALSLEYWQVSLGGFLSAITFIIQDAVQSNLDIALQASICAGNRSRSFCPVEGYASLF